MAYCLSRTFRIDAKVNSRASGNIWIQPTESVCTQMQNGTASKSCLNPGLLSYDEFLLGTLVSDVISTISEERERKLIIKYLASISSIWCLTITIGLWIIVRCLIQLNSESKDISQFPERQELKYSKVFKIQSKPNLKIWKEKDTLQGQMPKSGK